MHKSPCTWYRHTRLPPPMPPSFLKYTPLYTRARSTTGSCRYYLQLRAHHEHHACTIGGRHMRVLSVYVPPRVNCRSRVDPVSGVLSLTCKMLSPISVGTPFLLEHDPPLPLQKTLHTRTDRQTQTSTWAHEHADKQSSTWDITADIHR